MTAAKGSASGRSAPAPIPGGWLRRVWERMAAIYPHKWTSAMGVSPNAEDGSLTVYGDTWAKGLAGLTPEELGVGLEACIRRDDRWPPVLAEFRELCLAIPTFAQVREDLTREHTQRAPFTVMVGRRLDGHRYRLAEVREADRLLREAYAEAREARMKGEPLPEPLQAIAQDTAPPEPASPEVAAEHLDAIRRELNRGGPA